MILYSKKNLILIYSIPFSTVISKSSKYHNIIFKTLL